MAVFLNILNRWESAELNQEEAAKLLGCELTFRRWTALGSFRQNVRRGILAEGPLREATRSLAIGGVRMFSQETGARAQLSLRYL